MQTFITDKDFYKSAANLDTRRLGAQMYESIHILASLLDCTDKLVNPKRNIKNHPAAQLWERYEQELFYYITSHIYIWVNIRKYESKISRMNLKILEIYNANKLNFFKEYNPEYPKYPYWITDELIQVHRSVLIQKKSEYYKKLWPNIPDNLKMRYDWRGNIK